MSTRYDRGNPLISFRIFNYIILMNENIIIHRWIIFFFLVQNRINILPQLAIKLYIKINGGNGILLPL